jgi:hypothetical protein
VTGQECGNVLRGRGAETEQWPRDCWLGKSAEVVGKSPAAPEAPSLAGGAASGLHSAQEGRIIDRRAWHRREVAVAERCPYPATCQGGSDPALPEDESP